MAKPKPTPIWRPPTDLFELGDRIIVRVEVAGMRVADFDISLDDRRLVIRGSRFDRGENRAFHQMEISFGEFRTELELPGPVDPRRVEAHYHGGFLQIELPKAGAGMDEGAGIRKYRENV